MLTREQARKQPCKPNDAICKVDECLAAIMAMTGAKSASSQPEVDEINSNLGVILGSIKAAYFCTANDCPKWVDCESMGEKCEARFECDTIDSFHCNDCPHRYGRCGG